MGPGTHVITKVLNGVEPTSYTDALALRHDLQYLTSGEKFKEDWQAIAASDWSTQGIAMKVGLTGRIVFDAVSHLLPFDKKFHLNNSKNIDDELLKEVVQKAQPMLAKWNIKY